MFRINLVKGNKVNADDAAKVKTVNTSEFSMISLTQTFICLLLAHNQYYITIKTCLFLRCSLFHSKVMTISKFLTYKSRALGTVKCESSSMQPFTSISNTHPDVSKKSSPTSKLIQINKNTHCFTEEL